MTEYEVCIIGLQAALNLMIKDWRYIGTLSISQVVGEWEIKSHELAKYHKCLTHLKNMFSFISLTCTEDQK